MQSPDSVIHDLLNELATSVQHLPADLRPTAFSVLLKHRLGVAGTRQHKQVANNADATPTSQVASSMGEYLSSFSANLREDEKLLAAIAFAQSASEDNSATIETAHNHLKDAGIKLSNAAVFGQRLIQKKHVFSVGKTGKSMRLRVSAIGASALEKLSSPLN